MSSSLTKRIFKSIQRHDRIPVILIADHSRIAPAAMIPENQHVFLRAVVLRCPADKVGKCLPIGHTGFFCFIHQNISILPVIPALQSVIRNLESKLLFRIPVLCPACLHQKIHSVIGQCLGNRAQVQRRCACIRFKVCTTQIQQDIPFTFLTLLSFGQRLEFCRFTGLCLPGLFGFPGGGNTTQPHRQRQRKQHRNHSFHKQLLFKYVPIVF